MLRLWLRAACMCVIGAPAAALAGDAAFAEPELLPLPAVRRPARHPVYTPAPAVAPVAYPLVANADPYAAGYAAQPAYPQGGYAQPPGGYVPQQGGYPPPQGYGVYPHPQSAYAPPPMGYSRPYTAAAVEPGVWVDGGPMVAQEVAPGHALPNAAPQAAPQYAAGAPGPLQQQVMDYEEQILDPACAECCQVDCCCEPCCPWFGSLGGLILTRDPSNEVRLTCACSGGFLDSTSADPSNDWTGGYELRFGRRFCGCYAWEVNWWQLDDANQFANLYAPNNNINSALNFGTLNAGGTDMSTIFYNSRDQRVYRENSFQNLEINLMRSPSVWNWGPGFQVGWLAGVRWFRFDESLLYGATAAGVDWGTDPLQTGFYHIDVENNLIGGQVGAAAVCAFSPRWSLFAVPKVGLFGNAIEQTQEIYRGDGARALFIDTYKTDVSFLSQFDLGVNYRFGGFWSAFIGYRVVAIAGVALADNQIPQSFNDVEQLQTVDSNGSLLLHGVFAGVGFNY